MNKWCIAATVICLIPTKLFAGESIFDSMHAKMSYLSQRQQLIAKNIANADTPKYKALDLDSVNFNEIEKRRSGKVTVATTNPGHIAMRPPGYNFRVVKDKDAYETEPNGNNVSLEQQMVKMNETDLDYRATTGLLRKMNGLVKTAIGSNSE